MFRPIKRIKELKEFKQKIKGIFDNWKITHHRVEKDKYSLWISNGYSFFRDEGDAFLQCFTPRERRLLWKELRGGRKNRDKIFKEFNLTKEEDKNV